MNESYKVTVKKFTMTSLYIYFFFLFVKLKIKYNLYFKYNLSILRSFFTPEKQINFSPSQAAHGRCVAVAKGNKRWHRHLNAQKKKLWIDAFIDCKAK